jgi:hypothetical protein
MNKPLMNTRLKLAATLVAAAFATTAVAQKPDAKGGVVVASEPGKAAIVSAKEISAQVVGLDKSTRTVTLKGPEGNVVDVVAGDEVKNFAQIKLGDFVVARFIQAVTLELQKTKSAKAGADTVTVREEAAKAKPGERPAIAGARQITAIADVTAVDPKNSTITLRGPRGNSVVLAVQNPDQFKVVKKGDKVEVTYTEAMAVSVEPAPPAGTVKKK